MSSSSFRNTIQAYCKKKLCWVCLKQKTPEAGDVMDCIFCNAVYHERCLQKAAGRDSADCCLTQNFRGDTTCRLCDKSGAPPDPQTKIPMHPICKYNGKFIVNEFVMDGSKHCKVCASNKGMLVKCKAEHSHKCSDAFHVYCHQSVPLSLPEVLERCFFEKITLSCLLGTSPAMIKCLKEFKKCQDHMKNNPGGQLEDTSLVDFSLVHQKSRDVTQGHTNSTLELDYGKENKASRRVTPKPGDIEMNQSKKQESTIQDLLIQFDEKPQERKHTEVVQSLNQSHYEVLKNGIPVRAFKSASNKAMHSRTSIEPETFDVDEVFANKFDQVETISSGKKNPHLLLPTEDPRERNNLAIKDLMNMTVYSQLDMKAIDISAFKKSIDDKFEIYSDLLKSTVAGPPLTETKPGCHKGNLTAYMTEHQEEAMAVVRRRLSRNPKPSNS